MKNTKRRLSACALGLGFESLEDRVVMSLSAIAPPDFVLEEVRESLVDREPVVEAFADSPYATSEGNLAIQSGLEAIRNEYGFRGSGQTVAVIDTGIAWDHSALGQGYGAGSRVVGGWDFAENDADAYDDGLMGSHGTHVAGILGSDSTLYSGVAPGVDLVALRVFNDQGEGNFGWVESALDWVHENRNAFENPITTVNLSLGTDWNAENVPNWATLEDEFTQLEADGIFIAVAAGNSFEQFNTPGLSYPAASASVVPVMSVDAGGGLSSFSQRSQVAIAAPGSRITSTVPDYVGNQNGKTDDFAAYSGTSMASPYVAGASILLREAMLFVGQTDVTQDQIYGVMRDTASSFYDAATGQNYLRIDLDAALDSIMPDDEFGSTVGTAHDLGAIADQSSVSGLIGTLSDVDYFTFTAEASGIVTFATSNNSGTLTQWEAGDSGGSVDASGNWTFDVVQGQSYTVGIASNDGLGFYTVDVSLEASFVVVDWGAVEFLEIADLANAGETWYRMAATRDGILTAEARFAHLAGNLDLELYDAQMQLVGSSRGRSNSERIDYSSNAGEEFYLKVIGDNAEIDFRLANLVSQNGDTVTVAGTAGDDDFTFNAGTVYAEGVASVPDAGPARHQIRINGLWYQFLPAEVKDIRFDGGAGQDRAKLTGTAGDERLYAHPNWVRFVGADFEILATGVERTITKSGGGNDQAQMYDSGGDDTFKGTATYAYMSGPGFFHRVSEFDRVYGYSTSGDDRAFLYGSSGNDIFKGTPDYSYLAGQEFNNYVLDFERVYAFDSPGMDRAFLYDSSGNDRYYGTQAYVYLSGSGFFNKASGFERSYAYASTGQDQASIYGSAQNETLSVSPARLWFNSSSLSQEIKSFEDVAVYSGDGDDRVVFEKAMSEGILDRIADSVTYADGDRQIRASDFQFIELYLDGQRLTSFTDKADSLFEQFGSES